MNENHLGSRPARRAWTAEEVRALGTRTDLVTACAVVYGVGKNKSWEMYHANQLDFPALRCGRRVVVPVAPLLALLGLDTAARPEPGSRDAQDKEIPAGMHARRVS